MSPEREAVLVAAWRRLLLAASAAAEAAEQEPVVLAEAREAVRHMATPEAPDADAGLVVLLRQADLFLKAGPRRRPLFAAGLAALAEQAATLIDPPVDGRTLAALNGGVSEGED